MSKPSTNIAIFSKKGSKILLNILGIVLTVYAVMALIIHYSLHYSLESYRFSDSLKAVFDPETAAFQFFIYFMLSNIIWIAGALLIHFFVSRLRRKKD